MKNLSRIETLFTRQTALLVSGIYGAFGIVYIYVSGWLVLMMYSDPADLARAEMYKGWGFIICSSVLLFVIVHLAARALRRAAQKEIDAVVQYQRMIETTNEGVWKVDGGGRTLFINQTMADMLGLDRDAVLGKPEAMFLDEQWSTIAIEYLERQRNGSRDRYECRFKRPDGRELWAVIAAAPMQDAKGNFGGVLRMVTDITERKRMELDLQESHDAQRQLLDELDHRVRNNLASLISLVDLSRKTNEDSDAFVSSIRGRIDAMNRAHNLLSASGWRQQDLEHLLKVLVPDAYRSRVTISGPKCRCPATASGALALLFHELLMNAVKHGSLSVPDGEVNVTWSTEHTGSEKRRIDLHWRETGGPAPPETVQERAGLQLVVGLARTDLRGGAEFDFPPTGADHRFTLWLNAAPEPRQPHRSASAAAASSAR